MKLHDIVRVKTTGALGTILWTVDCNTTRLNIHTVEIAISNEVEDFFEHQLEKVDMDEVPKDPHYVKIIGFPGNESMWIILTEGSEDDGVGTLSNNPVCSDLEFGERIRFGGGTDELRASYIETVPPREVNY